MKTPIVVLALAAASQAVRVPLCSAICMTNAIAVTGCSASDTACICTSERFFPTVAECAEVDCNADKSVVDTAQGFCANAGIHVEVKRWGGSERHEGGRWGRGRWKGFPSKEEEKWKGFKGWWGGKPEETEKWGDWAPAPVSPPKGETKPSPPKVETPPTEKWGDWKGAPPHRGRPWQPEPEHEWPPHHPSPPEHHPHPTNPWEPPQTVW